MPPLGINNQSNLNTGSNLYAVSETNNNIINPTQLPNLHASLNSVTGTGTLNTVTSSSGAMNNIQMGLSLVQQTSAGTYNNNQFSSNIYNNQSELSPQAYSNKYQDQLIRKIANQSSFMAGSKGFNQSNSPTQRLYKESSKQSLGTIYSSGNTITNQFNQQSTRQSQFRSSRLYQKFYNPNGINSNPPTHHLVNHEFQQSLGTLNGGNSNHSLDKLPYAKQPAVSYNAVDKITSGENSITKNRNSSNHNTLGNTIASSYAQNSSQQPSSIFNQLQQTLNNQASKRMSLYQKRKMKINQISQSNISITDERSTEIHEENSITNYSNCNGMIGMESHGQQITPYKTLNNFNNLKSMQKDSSKQSSQLRNSNAGNNNANANQSQYLFQNQFKSYQRKSKFAQRQEGSLSIQNAGEIISDRDQYTGTIVGGSQIPDTLNTHSLLLKIEEDNNEIKISSKTELPELRQSKYNQGMYQQNTMTNSIMPSLTAYNRLQNNQSININRVNQQLQPQMQQQRFHQSFINSQTSSRTQLAQIVGSHNGDNKTYLEQLQNSNKKKTTKMNSIRINQELINNQKVDSVQSQSNQLKENKQNLSNSPQHQKQKHHSLQPYKKKQSSQSISLKTQTSFNQSANKIRIEINKEESVLQFLTKDHKSGVSLLYYDFNNANQRLNQQSKPPRVQQNLADLIIPEETEEFPPLLQQVSTTKEDVIRQDSAQILARIQKNSQSQTNQQNSGVLLITQNSFNNQPKDSPRNDVEIVNQKIDKARKKISRYFAQNQSLNNINLQSQNSSQSQLTKEQQKALKNLSVDMVRMGSPFFGANMHNQILNQSSPMKVINNKQSDSSLKFSPIKSQRPQLQLVNNNTTNNINFHSSAINTQRSQEEGIIGGTLTLNDNSNKMYNDTSGSNNVQISVRDRDSILNDPQQQTIGNISRNTKGSKTLDHQPNQFNNAENSFANNHNNSSSPQDEYTNDFSFNQDEDSFSNTQVNQQQQEGNDSNLKYIDIEDQSFSIKQIEDLNFDKIDQAMSMRNGGKTFSQANNGHGLQPGSFTTQITPHLKVHNLDPMLIKQKTSNQTQLSSANILISHNSSYSQESFYENQNNNYQNQTSSSKFLLNNSANQISSSQLSNKNLNPQNRKTQFIQSNSKQRFSHQYPLQPNPNINIGANKKLTQNTQQLLQVQQQEHQQNHSMTMSKNSISSQSKLPFISTHSQLQTHNQQQVKSNMENKRRNERQSIENNIGTGEQNKSRLKKAKRTSTVEYIKDDDEIFN
eukprot:403371695